jgi:hypothetical protein
VTEQNPVALTEGECGALRLPVPAGEPKFIVGTHGQVLQWVGDGRTLIALTVTVRRQTRMTSPFALRNHLSWELDRLAERMEGELRREEPGIDSESSTPVGTIDGHREGLDTHNRVLVSTDGQDMYIVHVMVTDTDAGRALAGEVLDGVGF